MKNFLYLFILFFAACSSPQTEKEPKSDSAKTKSIPAKANKEEPRAAVGVPTDRTLYYFNGLLGGKYSIEVTLSESNDSIFGQYRYTSQTDYLTLKGKRTNNEFILKEYDPFGKPTGVFTGVKNDSGFSGTWTNGKRTFPFVFTPKVEEKFAGAVMIETVTKEIKSGKCVCATFLLPVVTRAASQQIQDSLNYQLRVGAFTFGDDDICECNENGSYGVTSGSFEILRNQGNVLSIQWCGETMGAYPDSYCSYKNFDVRNGKLISLKDVYEEDGMANILSIVDSKLNERLKELAQDEEVDEDSKEWIADLTKEKVFTDDNLTEFSFDEKGITIRYSFGFPHAIQCYEPGGDVLIPYEDLERWIKKGGVLDMEN